MSSFKTLISPLAPSVWKEADDKHVVAVAFGSNLGDRLANIEHALRLLEDPDILNPADTNSSSRKAYIIDTSFLYETAPMYVTDQPDFMNGACLIETNIAPMALLSILKHIENTVGRTPTIRNGPRAIDLDIITYDSLVMDSRPEDERAGLDNLTGNLIIPHPRVLEREFVLRPLTDILPEWKHPSTGKSVKEHLNALVSSRAPEEPPMYKLLPFPRTSPSGTTWTHWKHPVAEYRSLAASPRTTHIMGTLNATPDSFSDGSDHLALAPALAYVQASVDAGAYIIDIGGYSTRPGAAFVSPEEEIARVVPIIRAIREGSGLTPPARDVLISVDTFRPAVAEAAVHAGANCINDVHALAGAQYPPNAVSAAHFLAFRRATRALGVPVILMHSRGDAGSNKDYSAFQHAPDAVVEAVKAELGARVDAAVRGPGGLRRWLVVADPGVGFSKTLEGNLEVIRHAARLTGDPTLLPSAEDQRPRPNPLYGLPLLIGASRKSFLGAILEKADPVSAYAGRATQPKEREWATAAVVACAVQQGALIVRVHGVQEMGDVVRTANAIW